MSRGNTRATVLAIGRHLLQQLDASKPPAADMCGTTQPEASQCWVYKARGWLVMMASILYRSSEFSSQLPEKLGADVLVRLPSGRRHQPSGSNRVSHPSLHLPAVEEVIQVVFKIIHVAQVHLVMLVMAFGGSSKTSKGWHGVGVLVVARAGRH